MNCQDFWNTFPQRAHDLTEEQRSHLDACSACAVRWAPHRALATGLESIGEEWRREEAPERVELGLTAAYRMQNSYRARRATQASWWTPVFAWAGAAAAMIALAVVLVRGWQPSVVRPQNVASPHRTSQPAPEYAQTPTTVESDSDDDSAVLGEGFVRLPNAPRIEPNEEVNVVRFEVPGSTMIALGLQVSEDRASETLLADVALGADGMARAVRLVPEGGTYEE